MVSAEFGKLVRPPAAWSFSSPQKRVISLMHGVRAERANGVDQSLNFFEGGPLPQKVSEPISSAPCWYHSAWVILCTLLYMRKMSQRLGMFLAVLKGTAGLRHSRVPAASENRGLPHTDIVKCHAVARF